VLLYSPIVRRDDFAAAIAYLVRRLDENTAPDNFLTSLFSIHPGNEVFEQQARRFAEAAGARHTVGTASNRGQDRSVPAEPGDPDAPFANESDTDFTQVPNRRWLHAALEAWAPQEQPVLAGVPDVDRAVATATSSTWGAVPGPRRAEVVNRVGDVVAARRGEILAVMAHEAGKTIAEGDPEVSEAVDFARYYARSVADIERLAAEGAPSLPLGTVVVAPPWNFPFAIALGGVTAALAAGNAVILKPAPQARRSARLVAECCWAAGVPAHALQYVPTPDDDAGRRLVTHPDVHAVILTGAHATARMFLDWRPDLRLHAETSGKNAMVITAAADLDLAIRDLVRSAFLHAGQKCSAASLAIVEAPVYDDPSFRRRLRDAAVSLRVGSAPELGTDIGPLIEAPGPALQRALTQLEPGESWLLQPQQRSERQWTPGIRWGVQPGSWFARTECFGPVLGVVRADDLDHAIRIQNDNDYGLTAGLQSLDPTEIRRWTDAVEAGNLYVNRGITGAIVRRQPFGGWKQSVVGPTVKAGGPHYVASLRNWPTADVRTDFAAWFAAASAGTDQSGLRAESNVLRVRPIAGGVALRIGAGAAADTERLARTAAAITGVRLEVSRAAGEPDDAFAARLASLGVRRLRLVGTGPEADPIRRAAHSAAIAVDEAPLHGHAEVEGVRWCHEQAISRTLHRHGHLRSSHQ
jgi:RHH-type proline utilization regulon transcriptional repressor/proline dehydrogenase/delta 1-pyrroline-5-carboxylate dehydrogenase